MATPIDPASLRVVDLKEELGKRNLAKTGKKDELVARLKEALAAEEATAAPPTETESAPATTEDETPAIQKTAPLTEQPIATLPTSPQNELPNAIEQQAQMNDVVETPTLDTSTTETTQPTIEKQSTSTASEIDTSKSSEDSAMAPSTIPLSQKNDQSQPISSGEETDQQPLKRKREESAEDQEDKRTKTESKESIMETKEPVAHGEQNAVCIKGFVRPLITKHLQEFIKQYGDVKRFWIDPIKTHCYIIFDTTDQANNAFQSMNDMVYPPTNTGKQVTAIRLTSAQASQLMDREQQVADHHGRANWEKLLEKVLNNESIDEVTEQSPTTTKRRLGGLEQITRQLQQRGAVSAIMDQEQAPTPSILDRLSTSTASRLSMPTETTSQVTIAGIAKKEGKSLDDLFLKTKANPPLYYLPVDKDLAASRLEAAKNKSLE